MADARNTLVVLTGGYPFGSGEPFLEAELPVLARSFESIVLVPTGRSGPARPLPPGVRCETFLAGTSHGDILRALLRNPLGAAWQYARALAEEGAVPAYLRHPVGFLAIVGLNLFNYRLLEDFVAREGLREAVFYDYWLANSALALSRLRRNGVVHRAVARAHRFDLYDEAFPLGAVPFRAFCVAALDRVFAVSGDGLSYLAEKHPGAAGKLVLSRLGVEAQDGVEWPEPEQEPLIASCANLESFKRVDRVPEVLAGIGRPLRWIHFGDGPERPRVERAAAGLPDDVRWRLAGQVDRAEILDFYRHNRVDLFVSLSASEGLPVSMMEAISFGIPVLATGVGGVAELVNERTGRLVGMDEPAARIAAAARELLDGNGPSRAEIVEFFEEHFAAEKNFGEFAAMLRAL